MICSIWSVFKHWTLWLPMTESMSTQPYFTVYSIFLLALNDSILFHLRNNTFSKEFQHQYSIWKAVGVEITGNRDFERYINIIWIIFYFNLIFIIIIFNFLHFQSKFSSFKHLIWINFNFLHFQSKFSSFKHLIWINLNFQLNNFQFLWF